MEQNYRSLYAAHAAEIQHRWELALEAESFMAALVHSGTPMHSFLDDYEYAFRPNPHFLAWLPRHIHSATDTDSCIAIRRDGAVKEQIVFKTGSEWKLEA